MTNNTNSQDKTPTVTNTTIINLLNDMSVKDLGVMGFYEGDPKQIYKSLTALRAATLHIETHYLLSEPKISADLWYLTKFIKVAKVDIQIVREVVDFIKANKGSL